MVKNKKVISVFDIDFENPILDFDFDFESSNRYKFEELEEKYKKDFPFLFKEKYHIGIQNNIKIGSK